MNGTKLVKDPYRPIFPILCVLCASVANLAFTVDCKL